MKKSKTSPQKTPVPAKAGKAAVKTTAKAPAKPGVKAAPGKAKTATKAAAKAPAKAAVKTAAKTVTKTATKAAAKTAVKKTAAKVATKTVKKVAEKALPKTAAKAPAKVGAKSPATTATKAAVKTTAKAPAKAEAKTASAATAAATTAVKATKVKAATKAKTKEAAKVATPADAFPPLDADVKRAAKPFFMEVKPGVERVIKRGDKSAVSQVIDLQARRKGPATEESPEELAERIERELQSQSFMKRATLRPQMCTKCGINAVSPRFTIDRDLGYCDLCAEILRLGETKEARRMEVSLGVKKEEDEEPADDEAVPEEGLED